MAKAPDLGEGRNLRELEVILIVHGFSLKAKYVHITGPSSSVGETQKPL